MYIAVKGGEQAIDASRAWLAAVRRGDTQVPELGVPQVAQQLPLLVDRVMAEGSLYDPELAALALKQALGDLIEAVFLLRAYRTTLPRLAATEPVATRAMRVQRRVSAIFKDLPGGQVLGATYDYTQRLLDFGLLRAAAETPVPPEGELRDAQGPCRACPLDVLAQEGLIESAAPAPGDPAPPDLTREPLAFPLPRAARLQMLARGDEGLLLGARLLDAARLCATAIRLPARSAIGRVAVEIDARGAWLCDSHRRHRGHRVPDGQPVRRQRQTAPPQFTRGYGLAFGHSERKAMAMAWSTARCAPTSSARR